ncbi:transmembrane proteins 14C-domain-containing protein [Obelidium mucronatum]|nr:transmembrane proteins 14C-domain-containing protein [Obelidium mucronatum]
MVQSHVPAYLFASICAIGGTIGYVKGKSVPSLVAGLSCASLYALAGHRLATNATYGAEIAFGVSLLLLVMMGPKAIKAGKPVPRVMSLLGLIGTVFYGSIIFGSKAAKLD